MKRKETYLSRDFRETVALRFPAQAKELNTAFDMRLRCWLKMQMQARKSNTTSSGRSCRALRPTKPCSGSCRKRRHCKPFMAMWNAWRERATNSLPPCCTYRGFTALFPAFSSNPPGAFSARRRALSQKNCRAVGKPELDDLRRRAEFIWKKLCNLLQNVAYKVLITFNYKEGTQTVTSGEATEAASEGNGSDLDYFTAVEKGMTFAFTIQKQE